VAIFELTKDSLTALPATSFGTEGIYERKDLQRFLKQQIEVLSPDLMVIAEEFGDWADSNRRIDLLCLDRDANLVVVEIKRTDDGGHMELQAIRYAAMVSTMTFRQLVDAHAIYRQSEGLPGEEAEGVILEFLAWDEPQEEKFAGDVRIILASADFSKEVTSSVIWLNQHELDVRCIRMKPYRLPADGRLLLDVQQIIPLPEATDYQTQIRTKEQAGRQHRAERYDLRYKFWDRLLGLARTRTNLHANRKPGVYGWIGGGIGKAGLSLNYAVREDDSQVALTIDFGDGQDDRNLETFRWFEAHRQEITHTFGEGLEWEERPGRRSCSIRYVISGGWRSPQEEWPKIHQNMVEAMVRLNEAFRPYVQQLKT
jgi:hypothetical protein